MNILVLSWRDPKHPLAGGAEQVMHEHMKGWIEAGHNVTLFSSRFKDGKDKEELDRITIIRKGDQYIGVKLHVFFYWKKNKKRFDLVVDQFHGVPFFTPLYVKKPKLAVLQEVAREVWFMNELPIPLNWIIGLAGYLLEPVFFLFYRKVPFMVGSESAKEDLVRMRVSPENITIVPHGVITKRFSKLPPKEKIKTIVFLGALTKDKGIVDALKTFSILNKKGNYNFWVIGKSAPEYKNYLLSLCENLSIIDKVKFWGYVDDEKKFDLLARAHVLVNPSVREGWGLVNIEANSLKVPVVGYKSPGLLDSIKDQESGIICKKNDFQEIASRIEKLLNNQNKYKEMQIKSKVWADKFSWSRSIKISTRLIDLLNKDN